MSDQERKSTQTEVASDPAELKSGQVFRMRSIHDIFRKLHREKQRFERAGSNGEALADQVDAAINFAITAWHMTDWVWIQQEHKLREYFGVNSCREFQDEMRRRYPDLAVCDVIANAAKHGGTAYKMECRPEIETVLLADPVDKEPAGVELLAVRERRRWPLLVRRWSLKIEVDGKPEDPAALFYRVFGLWHKLIQQHYGAK